MPAFDGILDNTYGGGSKNITTAKGSENIYIDDSSYNQEAFDYSKKPPLSKTKTIQEDDVVFGTELLKPK